jgi:hypothetical protein
MSYLRQPFIWAEVSFSFSFSHPAVHLAAACIAKLRTDLIPMVSPMDKVFSFVSPPAKPQQVKIVFLLQI